MRGPRQAERGTKAATSSLAASRAYPFGRPTAGALALVATLLLGGTLIAVLPWVAQGSVIRACYNRANGALRWVAPRAHCRRGEAQISWNLAGPAGQKGPLGPPGFLGVQGVAGATGPGGKAGAPGSAAMPGMTGAAGGEAPGTIGATGSSGAPGEANTEKGATGMNGAIGAPGATGATGATGPSEGAGTIGPTGPTGPGLPATLAPGASETGVWIVATPHVTELAPILSGTDINFQVPLAGGIKNSAVECAGNPAETKSLPCNAKEMNLAETKEIISGAKGMPGCKATPAADPNLLEEPVAESGHFCAYTGVEELSGSGSTLAVKQGLIQVNGEAGVSPGGAMIAYAPEEIGAEGLVRAQGSWAVKG
jgi:hypothetical protein